MRNHSTRAISAVLAIVLAIVLSFAWATSSPGPAQAQGQGCIIDISGVIGIVICGGEIVDRLPLPTVKVTEKVVEEIIKTVRVPGPTVTQTVTVVEPGGKETVFVDGPGSTVTITEPAETVTVRVPNGTQSVNPDRGPRPTETVTEEVTVSPSGQPVVEDDRVSPSKDNDKKDPPPVDLGDGETTVVEVGLGLLSLLALAALILCALYFGYRLGYKDREKRDTSFMRALLEQASLRKTK